MLTVHRAELEAKKGNCSNPKCKSCKICNPIIFDICEQDDEEESKLFTSTDKSSLLTTPIPMLQHYIEATAQRQAAHQPTSK